MKEEIKVLDLENLLKEEDLVLEIFPTACKSSGH